MLNEEIMPLLKARLGISTDVRDKLLKALIDGIISECKNTYGIELDEWPEHIMFVLDWATWKYQHPEDGTTPRSIQYRLKNMIIQKECRNDESYLG